MKRLNEEMSIPINELAFFEETAAIIMQCRSVLKWSYATRFYMPDKTVQEKGEHEFFKYQQQQLEELCEKTTQLYESDVDYFIQ